MNTEDTDKEKELATLQLLKMERRYLENKRQAARVRALEAEIANAVALHAVMQAVSISALIRASSSCLPCNPWLTPDYAD
jgi:hypothetical protein